MKSSSDPMRVSWSFWGEGGVIPNVSLRIHILTIDRTIELGLELGLNLWFNNLPKAFCMYFVALPQAQKAYPCQHMKLSLSHCMPLNK